MDRLPDELIDHILHYLETLDVVRIQRVSTRLMKLGRDYALWRTLCYDHSTVEATRRLRELRNRNIQASNAGTARSDGLLSLTEALDAYQHGDKPPQPPETSAAVRYSRALANWDPGYPGENLDYYEEYIHRHAKINVDWRQLPGAKSDSDIRTATGAALLEAGDAARKHVVCPLDDGSVVVFDGASGNAIAGHSGPGLLTPGARSADVSQQMMTNVSSVDVVSINSALNRGFFAVGNMLHEVDLDHLSLISSKRFSLAEITALSTCGPGETLVVGSNDSVQLYDSRDSTCTATAQNLVRAELIAGPAPVPSGYIALTQPGPTSIIHDPCQNSSIWIAGRFTSLLQYSLRFFPRLESTLHSGARISCMTASPHSYIPRHLDLVEGPQISMAAHSARKSAAGWTAICAGVYKGKGSLELYSMSAQDSTHNGDKYLNRQTASASKLLSVASHGGKIVCSDGNGNIRWMERNGYSLARSFNINDLNARDPAAEASRLWPSSSDEALGQGDIVQKLLPYKQVSPSGHRSEKLLLWTTDGRLGTLHFGPVDSSQADEFHDAVEVQAESTAGRARQDAERQYDMAMRRALKRNADEVRFVRGLGLAS